MKDEPQLLAAMLDDLGRQESRYQPSPYWRRYCARIAKTLRREGVGNFRSSPLIGKGYADSVPRDPVDLWVGESWRTSFWRFVATKTKVRTALVAPYLKMIDYYLDQTRQYRNHYFQSEFGPWLAEMESRHSLPDTLAAGASDLVEVNGKTYAVNYIRQLLRIWNYAKHFDLTQVRTVFEIGGGFGANAHLLTHLYPNIRKYFYLDIPPVLYVSTEYLKHFYGGEVKDYLHTRNLESLRFQDDDSREILCACPWQLERADFKYELFWNSSSFQEMSPEIVANYLAFADKFAAPGAAKLCVMLYPERNPNRSVSIELVTRLAGERFALREFTPERQAEKTLRYFLGEKGI